MENQQKKGQKKNTETQTKKQIKTKAETQTKAKTQIKAKTPKKTQPKAQTPTKTIAKKPLQKEVKKNATGSSFKKSAGNPDVKTPRQTVTEMPVVNRTIEPIPLFDLLPFPISKKPDNRQNFGAIWEILKQLYPKPEVELNFETPFEILAATILSAQCTDRQVNTVTKKLFQKYKKIEDYAFADPAEFGRDIYSTGFYNSKTKHIIGSANIILNDYGGNVPNTMEELTKLPGVGRKTANIILSRGFNINVGIAVDTHVKRLSNKIGLTEYEDPEKIEKDLMQLVQKEEYDDLSLTLIFHGRRVCDAKKPKCDVCAISNLCPSAFT